MTSESMPVVLPADELSAGLLHLLSSDGPEAVLQRFPAMRGHEHLLDQVIEAEAGIADLENRAADLKEKADELSARVREILEAAPEASRSTL